MIFIIKDSKDPRLRNTHFATLEKDDAENSGEEGDEENGVKESRQKTDIGKKTTYRSNRWNQTKLASLCFS